MTLRNTVSILLCVTALIAGVAVSAGDANEQIRSVERERLRSLVNADVDAALRLHASDFQLINPLGGALTREQYLGQVASGEIDYLEWEPGSMEVRAYGDSAVIRYQATLKIKVAALPDAPSGRFWHTDLYEKKDGRWQVVWSQATQIR